MKHIKARIAAIAMAAITSVAAAQAISASAFRYTSKTQTQCETASYMNSIMTNWKNSTFRQNAYWNQNLTSGVVVGPNFSNVTISGKYEGAPLSGSEALVRKMAQLYFGTNIFQEVYCNGKFYSAQLGDQLVITRNGQKRYLFVTDNGYTELVNNRIKHNNNYQISNGVMIIGNQTWICDYVLRPVKQGDANGDGTVIAFDYYVWNSDLTAISDYAAGNFPNGVRQDVLVAASSLNKDWTINSTDYNALKDDQRETPGFNYTGYSYNGRMNGNYGYVTRLW